MDQNRHLPDANQLSVLTSTILLAYALTPFINIPELEISFPFVGMVFVFQFNIRTVISLLVASLAAVGTDWLLRGHPSLGKKSTLQHWILPAFTAWVIGVPLNNLSVCPQWWAVFAFGSLLLVLILMSEYIVVDLSDELNALATVGLIAVSFALYLFLVIAVRAAELRLYLLLPALVIPLGLVCLRTLYMRLGGRWCYSWAIGISFVIGQFAISLHYWPLSPLAFGLIILGPAYSLTTLAWAVEEGRSQQLFWIEPVIMLCIMWLFVIIFGK